MDHGSIIMMLFIGCFVLVFVLEVLDDVLDVILYLVIAIAVVGVIGYTLYWEVLYPAYSACRRFIGEHPVIFVAIVVAVLALVLLIILLCIWGNRRRLLTTDYTSLIHQCDQEIASATEALERALVAEERHRLTNEFEMLEPGRHKYGYNPNRFEREVDECEDTLKRLKDKKRYYEEQKRKADKWL